MRRNPFAAVWAALKAQISRHYDEQYPARRTVTLPMPAEAPRARNKVSRRKRLAATWSRAVMARLPHPLAIARRSGDAAHPNEPIRPSNRVVRKAVVR